MDLPKRKQTRLKSWDYSDPGAYFITICTRDIHRLHPDLEVWQRSYYDHVIRNEDDWRTVAEYIDANPAKWAEDRFYPPGE